MFARQIFLSGFRYNGFQRTTLYRNIFTRLSESPGRDNLFSNINLVRTIRTPTQIQYSSSVNKDGKNETKVSEEPNNLTRVKKLKKAVADYGATVIVFHVSISLLSLGSCYLLVSSGLDMNEVLIKIGLQEWVKENLVLVSNASTFAVAYAIHKIFAPVRISITLASVPFIVRYLRQKGILKK